jgi:hypothetical protein
MIRRLIIALAFTNQCVRATIVVQGFYAIRADPAGSRSSVRWTARERLVGTTIVFSGFALTSRVTTEGMPLRRNL